MRKKWGGPGPRVGRDKVRAPGGNSGVTPDRSPPPPPLVFNSWWPEGGGGGGATGRAGGGGF